MRRSHLAALVFLLPAAAQAQFGQASYNASQTITDGLSSTTMMMAFDGTYYWSTSGGGTGGTRLAQYTAGGALLATFAPGLDFRSVFSDAGGNVYARQFANSNIYKMTTPGSFSTLLSLTGGPLDDQSAVVLNGAGTGFLAFNLGTVTQWDLSGNNLGTTSLAGYGSLAGESSYPENRGIAAVGNVWLTYSDNATLSMWDQSGNRLGTTVLNGAGGSFDSYFGDSYANGMEWVVDNSSGTWRGYDVGLGNGNVVSATPEPGSLALIGTGLLGMIGVATRRRKGKTA